MESSLICQLIHRAAYGICVDASTRNAYGSWRFRACGGGARAPFRLVGMGTLRGAPALPRSRSSNHNAQPGQGAGFDREQLANAVIRVSVFATAELVLKGPR